MFLSACLGFQKLSLSRASHHVLRDILLAKMCKVEDALVWSCSRRTAGAFEKVVHFAFFQRKITKLSGNFCFLAQFLPVTLFEPSLSLAHEGFSIFF